jgi:hypothetical protein
MMSGPAGTMAVVTELTIAEIAPVVRSAWSAETCDPVDLADWSIGNPARGQCGVTALVICDLLGGELLIAEVIRADGSRQGIHYWNRLPDGTEVDLTVEQFAPSEVVQPPVAITRPTGPPARCADQYQRLRERVFSSLGQPLTSTESGHRGSRR